ncbi:MAG: M23 family metallopeptidase [Candidatus Jacksonbacteria bacterium]|nr:M23 family metallopeptidase [Candidatus Jacksonbacteria bacterium]
MKYFFLLITTLILTGCQHEKSAVNTATIVEPPPQPTTSTPTASPDVPSKPPSIIEKEVDFSASDTDYQFKALIPPSYQVEYVAQLESINIYDPAAEGESIRDKSQIFIRKFSANAFLTLNTVDIFSREEKMVGRHKAILYDIQKKQSVADFPDQPKWRNERHQVLDVRHAEINPSIFFVFAYNPALGDAEFQRFINSIIFYNDRESFRQPLSPAENRVTKKSFGIYITPENSPVQPEKFTGYHTGTDFEIFEDELRPDIPVLAVCGGVIKERKRVNGYGGVVIQECVFEDEPVRVLYGHVSLDDEFALRPIGAGVGTYIPPGRIITKLGEDKSEETDGELKHLHLGIIKGTTVDLRGYVSNNAELDKWFDFGEFIQL